MAIKVGGTSIIDDNKNISNVGIITIGTGGTSGTIQVGTGSTIFGSGNVSFAGTINALDVVVPLKVESFSPDNAQTNVVVSSDIRVTFNKAIGIGTTGFIKIKKYNGTITDTFGVGSSFVTRADANRTLVIRPTSNFGKSLPGIANTITPVIDKSFISNSDFSGINTTGSNVNYDFVIESVALGDANYEGGFLICAAGGTQWIVSPRNTEIGSSWYGRGGAVTCAQTVTGCTGWFVPSLGQMQNPGHRCRIYWDYSNQFYWTNNASLPTSTRISFPGGGSGNYQGNCVYCIRAFRCVTY